MNTADSAQRAGQELALIVLQPGKPQQVLAKFLNLMLNYQYGLSIVVAPDLEKAASLLQEHRSRIRCVCVIQDDEISGQISLQALGLQGSVPLFLILPTKKLGLQRMAASGVDGLHFCAWEKAFSQGGASLQSAVGGALEEIGVGNLFRDADEGPYSEIQQQVERRLRSINTLPTLPEIVMRIMRMVNDPKTTPEQLEQVLCTDPAIVMKLLQVMRSPVFTGTGGRTAKWTLKDIITRLGVKKVGAIAQQVKMINSLVKPDESDFDMQRYWEHSVGTAIIADRLVTERLVRLQVPMEFTDYWIGALLHDVGKLVLGFFFWDWLERILAHRTQKGCSFRQAEIDLGDVASHQRIGQLMLLNSDMGEGTVTAVGNHHNTDSPTELLSLMHVADNLAKALGLGYLPGEEAEFDDGLLSVIGLTSGKVEALCDELQKEMVQEIKTVVAACM